MSTPATFDTAAYETLKYSVSSDPAFLASLITDYLEDTEQHLITMRRAVATRNAKLLERTAHTLKSTSETLGAAALATISRTIESLAHDGRLAEAATQIPDAIDEFSAVRSILQKEQASLEDVR